MDELKYKDGKFTVNGIDVSNVSATTEAVEIAQAVSANTQQFSVFDDIEGRTEITTDGEDKVMSYRDADGKKHEHDMEITNLDVSNLNLQGNSVNNIQDALKANGFNVKAPIDWSDNSFIQIPEPRFAIINVTNIDSMPTTKQDNKEAFLEFWDMHGNYFK